MGFGFLTATHEDTAWDQEQPPKQEQKPAERPLIEYHYEPYKPKPKTVTPKAPNPLGLPTKLSYSEETQREIVGAGYGHVSRSHALKKKENAPPDEIDKILTWVGQQPRNGDQIPVFSKNGVRVTYSKIPSHDGPWRELNVYYRGKVIMNITDLDGVEYSQSQANPGRPVRGSGALYSLGSHQTYADMFATLNTLVGETAVPGLSELAQSCALGMASQMGKVNRAPLDYAEAITAIANSPITKKIVDSHAAAEGNKNYRIYQKGNGEFIRSDNGYEITIGGKSYISVLQFNGKFTVQPGTYGEKENGSTSGQKMAVLSWLAEVSLDASAPSHLREFAQMAAHYLGCFWTTP